MELTVCKKVCKECPFRKNSLQGWLGHHTIQEISDTMQLEGLFSCHMQRREDEEENLRQIMSGEQNICRGFMLSAKKTCKLFGGNPINGQALRELQKSMEVNEEELENILNKWEFIKHHTL